ncbi:MAG: helix-turn-helix domain-containing protein [Gemmataceae bacterium]|nr:helix-turn-helix domain-containing protein [Gemmataceae bacterium]
MEPLLTTKEILACLKIERGTLQTYIRLGMPVVRLPGVNRFRLSEVLAWAEEHAARMPRRGGQPTREGAADEA